MMWDFIFLIYLTLEFNATGCCKSRSVKADKAGYSASEWKERDEGKDSGSS